MDFPYLQFNEPVDELNERKLYIGDSIVLYSSLDLTPLIGDQTDDQSKVFISTDIKFRVISNYTTGADEIDKDHIIVKPIKIKKKRIRMSEYKLNITNIKYIVEDADSATTTGELSGIIDTFKVITTSYESPNIFDNKYFPNYEIDNLAELNDRILIDIYSKNIAENYNIKEMEIELRTFQNEIKYGGFKNTINSYQYNNLIKFFSNSGLFYPMTNEPNESLDILLEDIPNLRFTVLGRDSIYKFCSTNKITLDNTDLIYKDNISYKEDEELFKAHGTDKYYDQHFGPTRKKIDFAKGVLNLYSLRTKLGGKIEIPLSKTSDGLSWELNRDIISSNDNISASLDRAEKDLSRYKLLVRNNGTKFLKLFRLKSRSSFMYNNFIRIDLTKTKMSKESVIQKGRFIDIRHRPTYSFIDSDIVNQEEKYECEIEIVNIHLVEKSKLLDVLRTQIGIAINIIKYMNSIINERGGFIHTNIRDYVLDIYNLHVQKMMGARCASLGKTYYADNYKNKYISPNVKSFELFNLAEGYTININREYCVTDKADGLANLLFVLGTKELDIDGIDISTKLKNKLEGVLFFIDSNLQVHSSYISLFGPEAKNGYILNGEFLNFNKSRQPMNSYGIYDIYLYNSDDISGRPLLKKATDGTSSEIEDMNDGSPIYQPDPEYKDGNPIYETYTHTSEAGYSLWSREDFIKRFIILHKTQIPTFSRDEDDENPLLKWKDLEVFGKEFLVGTEDSTIFNKSREIWEQKDDKEYKLDGLIYTPTQDPVSYNEKKSNYSLYQWTTWNKNLK